MTTSTHTENPQLNQRAVLRYDLTHPGGSDPDELPLIDGATRTAGSADMEVNGPGSVQGAYPVNQIRHNTEVRKQTETRSISPRDEIEISAAGRMMDQLNQSSDLRAERLAQIKADIDAGTYETPQKLEAALMKLFGELESGD